jgi:Na+/H+ antiporter NhaD/arsenite permease-like protein
MVLKTIRLGKVGHRLYLDLYVCFFIIGAFLGNDPIMVVFLTYFVRVIENIKHPRAWIFTQFCIANIATGILVSSNPTNLVLTNAFNIRFVSFTANLVVPVVVTTVLLFPFLLYIVFHDESLIPNSMRSHDLPEELRNKKPRNINVPIVREKPDDGGSGESERAAEVELILNPYLDRLSSLIGSIIFGVTVVLLLALNAVYLSQGGNTDFWVTLPAAVIMLCWDLIRGWLNGSETRAITQNLISCAKAIGTVRLVERAMVYSYDL